MKARLSLWVGTCLQAYGLGTLMVHKSNVVPAEKLLLVPKEHSEHDWGSVIFGGMVACQACHLMRLEKDSLN
jgi:hypothetical protein